MIANAAHSSAQLCAGCTQTVPHTASTMGSTETPASSSKLSAVVRGVVGCTVCSCLTLRRSLRSSPCIQTHIKCLHDHMPAPMYLAAFSSVHLRVPQRQIAGSQHAEQWCPPQSCHCSLSLQEGSPTTKSQAAVSLWPAQGEAATPMTPCNSRVLSCKSLTHIHCAFRAPQMCRMPYSLDVSKRALHPALQKRWAHTITVTS